MKVFMGLMLPQSLGENIQKGFQFRPERSHPVLSPLILIGNFVSGVGGSKLAIGALQIN